MITCPNQGTNLILKNYFFLTDQLTTANIDRICSKKNPTKKKNKKGPMLNATRSILDKFYQASRIELAEIMNDDRWLWSEYT